MWGYAPEDLAAKAHQGSIAAQKLLDARCKNSGRADPKAKTGDVSTITQSIEKAGGGAGKAQTVVMKRSGSKGTLGKGPLQHRDFVNTSRIEGASEHVINKTKQAIRKMEAMQVNAKPSFSHKVHVPEKTRSIGHDP